jgi:hypothetical protein
MVTMPYLASRISDTLDGILRGDQAEIDSRHQQSVLVRHLIVSVIEHVAQYIEHGKGLMTTK